MANNKPMFVMLDKPDYEEMTYVIFFKFEGVNMFEEVIGRTDTYERCKELITDGIDIDASFVLYAGDPDIQEDARKGEPWFSKKPIKQYMKFMEKYYPNDSFDINDYVDDTNDDDREIDDLFKNITNADLIREYMMNDEGGEE